MTGQRDLDMFPADIDAIAERELRHLFAAAQAPRQSDELVGEALDVAMMAEIVRRQTSTPHPVQGRARLRVVASRGAAIAVVAGFAVVSTSVAAAAGILPRPMQSVFERAARVAGWHVFDHDDASGAIHTDPVPRSTVAITGEPDVVRTTEPPAFVVRTTEPPAVVVDPTSPDASPTAEASPPAPPEVPSSVPPIDATDTPTADPPEVPSSVPPIDATDTPAADPALPSTSDGDPQSAPTVPPQANGDGPLPADEPSPADDGTNHAPNANANPNATANGNGNGNAENANANGHGGNPNANGNASGNGSDRGSGDG